MGTERLKLVIFGLSVSSSWGNGHATLWRGLIRALTALGHQVVFFEKDVPYYAQHRDLTRLPEGAELVLYRDWESAVWSARRHLREADVGMVTSYCPDAIPACAELLEAPLAVRCFYDLDTGVTLDRVRAGERVEYLPPYGLEDFDLVLSYTGGKALEELERLLGARTVAPLYGSVDPTVHACAERRPELAADLSYLGTYAANRQTLLQELFLTPARRLPERSFVIAGAQYPQDFPWEPNVRYVRHLPPADHGTFYSSSRLTLNVTRAPMARRGYCPSARFFEASACGVPVLTDAWEGLERFFTPGEEVLVAHDADQVVAALSLPAEALARIGRRARERTLSEHTAAHRAVELLGHLEAATARRRRGEG